MSEEKMLKDIFSLFAQSQMTYAEAEEKVKSEAGRPKVERFRTSEDGEYSIRILPLAPNFDADGNMLPPERKGYEYPVHQLFLTINCPTKPGKKAKKVTIPVVRATDKGIDKPVDLIDKYVQIAKELYSDDDDLLEKIQSNSYSGGLRWGYSHAMMVLDVSSDKERAKGPQIWQCSHAQYKDISGAEMRLWKELNEDGEQACSPVGGLTDAYPIKVIRGNNGGRTEYRVEIGRKIVDVTAEEVQKLLDLPRIPEQIYEFSRYLLEAEVEYLKQYDELHAIDVCKEKDFIEAVETLKQSLSPDDTRGFDLASAGKDSAKSGNSAAEVTIDSLWDEYDKIADAGLSDKSEEYQDLRERIRQFAEDKNLDVRLSRSKNNKQLLEEIEEALDDAVAQGKTSAAPVEAPTSKVEVKNDDEDEEADDEPKEQPQPERRARRPRPTALAEESKEETEDEGDEEDAPKAEAEKPVEEERPLHRRRRR